MRSPVIPTTPSAIGLPRREVGRGWVILFILFSTVYALTANRGAQWQDSGFHILRIVTGELVNPLGLALSHPLHHWLGRLIVLPEVIEPAFAITLISSFAGALAVANTFGCVCALTGRPSAAYFAAASLGVAQTFWQMATVAETYTLTTAMFTAECWCLALFLRGGSSRYLMAALALNGLGIANHLLALLSLPVLLVVAICSRKPRGLTGRWLLAAAGWWLLGTLPYTALVAIQIVRAGDGTATLHSALFGHAYAGAVLNAAVQPRVLMISMGFLGLSFPSLLVPLAIYGIARSLRGALPKTLAYALIAEVVLHAVFVLRYNIVDQHTFFLPLFALLCLFGGLGFHGVRTWPQAARRRTVLIAALVMLAWTPLIGALAPTLIRRSGLIDSIVRHKPYRDDYTYLFTPWSVADDSAERMSRKAIALAGPQGLIVIEDSMAAFAVRYRVIRSGQSGIEIASPPNEEQVLQAIAAGRPVVLIPGNVSEPRTQLPSGRWRLAEQLYVRQAD